MNDFPSGDETMEFEYLQLIDYLVNDIQELELEVIRLRYELSNRLPAYDGLMLKCDIFSASGKMKEMAHQGYLE